MYEATESINTTRTERWDTIFTTNNQNNPTESTQREKAQPQILSDLNPQPSTQASTKAQSSQVRQPSSDQDSYSPNIPWTDQSNECSTSSLEIGRSTDSSSNHEYLDEMKGFAGSLCHISPPLEPTPPHHTLRTTSSGTESISYSSSNSVADLSSSSEYSDDVSELVSCPYKVGTPLKLEQDGKIINATIKQVYTAGIREQFSNSCTVLIQVTDTSDGGREESKALPSRDMVVKIMDWRYMGSPRRDWHCGSWTVQRSHTVSNLCLEDAIALQDWLRLEMSEEAKSHSIIRSLIEDGILQKFPTRMDLYGYLIRQRHTEEADQYLQEHLIPQAPGIIQQELFLQVLVNIQLAIEARTAAVIQSSMPGWMPLSYGIFNVEIVSQTPLPKPFQLQGLLMDRAYGTPVALLPPRELSDDIVRGIIQEVILFQLELRRNDLDMRDANLYNILITRDDDGNMHIAVVDFGAIFSIVPDYHNAPLFEIGLLLSPSSSIVRVSQDYYRESFDLTIELDVVLGLVEHLANPSTQILSDINSVLSHWCNLDLSTPEDLFFWYTMILQVIYSINKQLFHTHGTSIVQLIRRVSQIMKHEYSRHSAEIPWWFYACDKIALLTRSNKAQAYKIISCLMDEKLKFSGINRMKSTAILRVLTGQHQFHVVGLMFDRINETITTMGDTWEADSDHAR